MVWQSLWGKKKLIYSREAMMKEMSNTAADHWRNPSDDKSVDDGDDAITS